MAKRKGYEQVLFYGPAGATAATQIVNHRDAEYSLDQEMGNTTVKGDGSAVPIVTEHVTGLVAQITFTMINKDDDTELAALIAASRTGVPVALLYKDYATGKGFDGDVNVKVTNGAPLQGEQTYDFECTPNDDLRQPILNA